MNNRTDPLQTPSFVGHQVVESPALVAIPAIAGVDIETVPELGIGFGQPVLVTDPREYGPLRDLGRVADSETGGAIQAQVAWLMAVNHGTGETGLALAIDVTSPVRASLLLWLQADGVSIEALGRHESIWVYAENPSLPDDLAGYYRFPNPRHTIPYMTSQFRRIAPGFLQSGAWPAR